MPKQPAQKNRLPAQAEAPKPRPGRRGDPLSAYPLTAEQLVRGIFQIKPEDVKRIVASKPGKKGK